MKRLKAVRLGLFLFVTSVVAYGQGTVVFNNRVPGTVDARVVLLDGTGTGVGWKAQLFGGPNGASLVPLIPITTFRTGAAAGYVVPVDVILPNVAPGAEATLVMKVFNGNSFDTSTGRGESKPFRVTVGGGILPPANLVGLQSIRVFPLAATPTLVLQPQSQVLVVGSTVTFRVEATGSGPFTYQWQKNESPIPGATSATLTLSNVSAFDSGNYRVIVSGLTPGATTSQVAVLSLPVDPNSGAVVLNNRVVGVVDARVILPDGKPAGPGYTAQLYGGPEGGNLQPLFPATTFRTSSSEAMGYVNPVDVAVTGVRPGERAALVMRVFNGKSFETSSERLESNPITIAVGGGVLPPSNLVGLKSFRVVTDVKPFVERQLPASYSPGGKLVVTLQASPPSAASVYAVEDYPPANWIVGQMSEGGLYDSMNKKVKFGPFFDRNPRALTYEVTPPAGENGEKEFNGTASADGANSPVGGATTISLATLHPADSNPSDSRMSIGEVTAYGVAWRKGVTWSIGPNPIPIEYITRAGTLWKNGESYILDPKISTPPLWWVNTTAVKLASANRGRGITPTANPSHGVVSLLPPQFVPGEPFTVRISVTPETGVSVYAAQDQVPAGWVVKNISQSGEFDPVNGQVKWGPFFDNTPRELSYDIVPLQNSAKSVGFSGFASFDGVNVAVKGQRQSRASHRLRGLSRRANGEFELDVAGQTGGKLVIEGSSDLVTWTPVVTTVNASGAVSFKDSDSNLKSLRFYRVVSE